MNERRVEVLVRAGEVVVVLSSVQELRELLASREGRAPAGDGEPPDPAAVDRGSLRRLPVAVDPQLWRAVQGAVSTMEGIVRETLAGGVVPRREWRDWLADVDLIRQQWRHVVPAVVSSQADEV